MKHFETVGMGRCLTVLLAGAVCLLPACGAADPGSLGNVSAAASMGASVDEGRGAEEATRKIAILDFHDAMRRLWEDHITWTRLAIVSLAGGLPDTQATVQRLLANQTDLGNAIKPFYGDAAGSQLTALLQDHIKLAAEIVVDAKQGNTQGVSDAAGRWYANADAIAAFLSAANPGRWPLDDLKMMMKGHLDDTLAEAVAYLQGDYPASVADYEVVHTKILEMADMLSAGIVRQFPDRFRGPECVSGSP